mmetsp:Transcript_10886/g.14960  ORF Transcript_10886/g.14960 Transcript_10886/m.14960 type:complete len:228 (-) Transcript_10886:969-1652(-)
MVPCIDHQVCLSKIRSNSYDVVPHSKGEISTTSSHFRDFLQVRFFFGLGCIVIKLLCFQLSYLPPNVFRCQFSSLREVCVRLCITQLFLGDGCHKSEQVSILGVRFSLNKLLKHLSSTLGSVHAGHSLYDLIIGFRNLQLDGVVCCGRWKGFVQFGNGFALGSKVFIVDFPEDSCSLTPQTQVLVVLCEFNLQRPPVFSTGFACIKFLDHGINHLGSFFISVGFAVQ